MKSLLSFLLGLSLLADISNAKAVFCHYMLGTITQEHAQTDIDQAKALGFAGFALNVGDPTQPFVQTSLDYMFSYAQSVGFKLYISIDLYASGNACFQRNTQCTKVYTCFQQGLAGCNGPYDYDWIWSRYNAWSAGSAYYQINGKPLMSTYSSGGYTNDTWIDWKGNLAGDIFFMPDFDETQGYYDADDGWWYYWGPIVDGIFSWESAWPERNGFGGVSIGDVSVDEKPLAGAHAHNKAYMMGLSPLQYKDSYGTNLYRSGEGNLPIRMRNILSMDPQPDYIEFQTWNDGPESHYIGNLWPEQNNDSQPNSYANQDTWPHTAWQPLVASFIDAFVNGHQGTAMTPQDGSIAVGALWYKSIITATVLCPNYAGQYYEQPQGFNSSVDELIWSVVLSPSAPNGPYSVTTFSGDKESATRQQTLTPGLNLGYSGDTVDAGLQTIIMTDGSGSVVMSASTGACISSGCPTSIYNCNYQVVPLVKGNPRTACTTLPRIDDLADPACSMTWTTSNDVSISDASTTINLTWANSGAGDYLDLFLHSHNLDDWLLTFFEEVVNCGDSPGGSIFDCHDIQSTCAAPTGKCTDYCPPQAYFIHVSIYNLFHFYQSFYQSITNSAVQQLLTDLHVIADTFAMPDSDLESLFSIFGGALTTVSGVAVFLGDVSLPEIGVVGDAIAAFAGIFAATNLGGGGDPSDPKEQLDELLGSALAQMFSSVNSTISRVFDTTASNGDITFIESFFKNGAFLDSQIVDYVLDVATKAFVSTMNQYCVVSAMQAASTIGTFSSGYAFLYSDAKEKTGFTTENDCSGIASMIWYNNTCIGFGTYSSSLTGGPNSEISFKTKFLSGSDLSTFQNYVPDMQSAIINAYNCHLNPSDTPTWPSQFDPNNLIQYPPCFFSLVGSLIQQ